MSADLVWQIARNNHAYLFKARNVRRTFSKETGNLKNINSPRLSGFANKVVLDIQPATDGKGVVLTTAHPVGGRKVKKSIVKTTLKKGARPTYRSIRGIAKNKRLSRKIQSLALRKASAIIAGQRMKPADKKKTEKSKK